MERRWLELGAFLRSRRARLQPAHVLPQDRRQVPGLRRGELAARIGVSAAYYTRLEQGRAPNVSDDVLTAVSRGLRLDDAEQAHVWRLARPAPQPGSDGSAENVRAPVRLLLETMFPSPALVLGRDRHLLAWNATAHALHAPHLDFRALDEPAQRPWWPDLLFCEPRVAEVFERLHEKRRDTVADLRAELGRRPENDRLSQLTASLRSRSETFEMLWQQYPIVVCAHHDRTYRHPVVGSLDLHDEFLELSDDDGQQLALFTAEPGSSSAHALRELAHISPPVVDPPRVGR
jgi:transcriptional regulator with XRE-family HTH domain